jgi:hypothetical protein
MVMSLFFGSSGMCLDGHLLGIEQVAALEDRGSSEAKCI